MQAICSGSSQSGLNTTTRTLSVPSGSAFAYTPTDSHTSVVPRRSISCPTVTTTDSPRPPNSPTPSARQFTWKCICFWFLIVGFICVRYKTIVLAAIPTNPICQNSGSSELPTEPEIQRQFHSVVVNCQRYFTAYGCVLLLAFSVVFQREDTG